MGMSTGTGMGMGTGMGKEPGPAPALPGWRRTGAAGALGMGQRGHRAAPLLSARSPLPLAAARLGSAARQRPPKALRGGCSLSPAGAAAAAASSSFSSSSSASSSASPPAGSGAPRAPPLPGPAVPPRGSGTAGDSGSIHGIRGNDPDRAMGTIVP